MRRKTHPKRTFLNLLIIAMTVFTVSKNPQLISNTLGQLLPTTPATVEEDPSEFLNPFVSRAVEDKAVSGDGPALTIKAFNGTYNYGLNTFEGDYPNNQNRRSILVSGGDVYIFEEDLFTRLDLPDEQESERVLEFLGNLVREQGSSFTIILRIENTSDNYLTTRDAGEDYLRYDIVTTRRNGETHFSTFTEYRIFKEGIEYLVVESNGVRQYYQSRYEGVNDSERRREMVNDQPQIKYLDALVGRGIAMLDGYFGIEEERVLPR